MESERLQNLQSFNILDTLDDKDFDDLTHLASHICETPISLVSLVDKDRQWFKSKVGLEARETPRSDSFCSHAIENQQEVMIVDDARKDVRFKDNPLVLGNPHIVFYAGVPLISPEGHALGTICVIDSKKKAFSAEQKRSLKALGNQVTNLLIMHRQSAELKAQVERNEFLNKEIHHRVLNNLQLLLDLLHLQISNDPKLKEEFQQFADRIRAVASVHKILFETEDLDVDLGRYLKELSESVLRQSSHEVELQFQSDQFLLNAKPALTIGIILNELLTNTSKYAFDKVDGHNLISIALENRGDGQFELKYADSGRGYEHAESSNQSSGFGQKLIKMLTADINGTVEFSTSPDTGTKYLIKAKPEG